MSLFKYFGNIEYAQKFITSGEVYFNSLGYFLDCENAYLRDELEGIVTFRPDNGLEINNITRRQKFIDGRFFHTLYNHVDDIFVFCVSKTFSNDLFEKFSSVCCVEIKDEVQFIKRVRCEIKKLYNRRVIRNDKLLCSDICYRNMREPPLNLHSVPERTLFTKSDAFQTENEFRFLFSKRKKAFKVIDSNYTRILTYDIVPQRNNHAKNNNMIIRLGSVEDICSFKF